MSGGVSGGIAPCSTNFSKSIGAIAVAPSDPSVIYVGTGAGIIRLFHPKEMETEMSKSPLEVIREGWDLKSFAKIFQECKRASAMIIGPGIGRADKTKKALKNNYKIWKTIKINKIKINKLNRFK